MNKEQNNDVEFIDDEEAAEKSSFQPKDTKKLRNELKACQKERQEYLEGWQRAKADLINFKRESEKQASVRAAFAVEDFIFQLLPVVDSFELALAHAKDEGVAHIYRQLVTLLKSNGVEQVDPLGKTFDPTQHESVATEIVENKKDDGTIVKVVQKGYTIHGKLIRPARVHVGTLEGS